MQIWVVHTGQLLCNEHNLRQFYVGHLQAPCRDLQPCKAHDGEGTPLDHRPHSAHLLIATIMGLLSNGLAANEGHQWLSYLGSRLQEQIS